MNEISSENDPKILMRLAKNGDIEAFSRLYELYFTPISRYIYFRVQDEMETEDLTQMVFFKIYSSIERFEDRNKSPLAYFFTVARNIVIDYWRKKKNVALNNSEKLIAGLKDAKKDPQKLMEEKEQKKAVNQAIQHLTEVQREVIILKFIQGFSNKEISKILEKTEDAIRQIQCRALKTLREYFKDFKDI